MFPKGPGVEPQQGVADGKGGVVIGHPLRSLANHSPVELGEEETVEADGIKVVL